MSAHADDPAVWTEGLTRTFGSLRAVDGVDLSIRQGELYAVLGPNGAGKTTTIQMLCCLLRPTDGTARIMGHDVRTDPIAVKQVIALSPQETAIAEHLDAWENLSLMAGMHGLDKAATKRRSAELLELMGLTDRAGERVKKYSGGMKRRLSIAMALVSDPQVLFLDEPTLGLDPQARRAIWEHIGRLKGEVTVVLTTHYLEEADALADRIAIIDEGRIVARGTASQLKGRVAGAGVTVVEVRDLTAAALDALREVYPTAHALDGRFENGRFENGRIEIEADDVSLYEIEDCLRPRGVTIESIDKRKVTLDDVFLELTGKQMRT